jgi:hypothetical protein
MRQGASSATEWGKFDVEFTCNPNGKGRTAMPTKCLVATVLTAAFLTTAAFAADSQQPPACPVWGGGGQGGPMGFLSQEQRVMHFADVQKATSGMNAEQARSYRMTERDKVTAMTADQRAKYAADLKSRWDALPAAQKTELQQQAATYWKNRPMGGHHWDCK